MSISTWRPLKDAPTKDGTIVAVRRIYRSDGESRAPHAVATCRGRAWFWNDGDRVNVINWEFAPIADTLELDRAIQGEIARAFGTLLAGVKSATRPTNQYADTDLVLALTRTRNILHVCMGGRIPDFSSTNEEP